MNTKIIKLDLNKDKLYEKIKAKQGDTKSRFLLFQLFDGASPFSLVNRSVRAYMIKPDGQEVFNDLVINDRNEGYCTLELTNQVLAKVGIVKIELMIIEGDKKLTSSVFELEVDKSINSEDSIVSTNEFSALLNGLASLSEYDNYKTQVQTNTGVLETNTRELAEIKDKVVNDNLVKYRYIATTFNGEAMKLVNMFSADGSLWYVPNPSGDFTSTTGNGTIRDPSMMQLSEWYYICYTKIGRGTGSTIGYCRTKNFIDYEEFGDIVIGAFNKLRAPEFFRDCKTFKTYLVFSGSTNTNTDDFRGYVQEINFSANGEIIKVGNYEQLTGCCNKNAIDFSIIQDAYKYYLVYKDETNKTMNFASSPNLKGDYTLISGGLFPKTEGAQIIKMENGYRVYYDNYERGMLSYRETYDGFISFTEEIDLGYPGDFHGKHMFVYDTKKNSGANILKPYCIVTNNESVQIPTNTITTIPLKSVTVNNGIEITGTEIIIPSNGSYLFTLSLAWATNANGYRLIKLEHNEKAFATSRVAAISDVETEQNLSGVIYATAGDRVRITVRHNSNTYIYLANSDVGVVLTCNKL